MSAYSLRRVFYCMGPQGRGRPFLLERLLQRESGPVIWYALINQDGELSVEY